MAKMNFQLGQRQAPLIRPLILNRPTQIEGDMAIEASKLALSNFTLFREILFQLLNQTFNWPINSELDYATDSEDEEIAFSYERKDLIRQKSTRWKSTGRTGVQMKRSRHEYSHKTAQDEMRRSHRRLWMHIAGILTCGRLPKSQRAAVVRKIHVATSRAAYSITSDRCLLDANVPSRSEVIKHKTRSITDDSGENEDADHSVLSLQIARFM
ncbi:hypothetical protein ACTXT7_000123 [Hymenolepis weldensis]